MVKENRFFHSDDYKNFRTWDEAAYIMETIALKAQSVSKEEMRDYCENFPDRVRELTESNPQFKQDYEDFLEVRFLNHIILSEDEKFVRLNKKFLTLKGIKLAVQDWRINDETLMKKQGLIRNKYKTRFSRYRKEAYEENKVVNKGIEIISVKRKHMQI